MHTRNDVHSNAHAEEYVDVNMVLSSEAVTAEGLNLNKDMDLESKKAAKCAK